jgi:4-amino-4-deoxy-L-arabinose transferase-like glycosyltransferase
MTGRSATSLLIGLVWSGVVLAVCQRGEPPVGLAALALMTGWIATFGVAAWGGGLLLHRAIMRRRPQGFDEALVAMALGLAVLQALAAAMGVAGLLRPIALLISLGLVSALGAVAVWKELRPNPDALRVPKALVLPLAIAALAWSFGVLSVTVDSAFYDQLHYHLAFPAQWLRAGRLLTFPRHDYSFYPAGMGLLYVYAIAALGPWSAQAIHWALGVVAVVASARVALRIGGAGAACWSAAILSATPVIIWISTTAGTDLGVAAFASVGWLALTLGLESTDRDRARWWITAGVVAGLAAGAKLLGALTVCVPLFVALLLAPGTGRSRLHRLAAWSLGAAIPLLPWLARNVWLTGNPVYPFLPTIFARGADAAAQAHRVEAQAALRFMSDPWRVLTLGALGPQDGSIGPLHLLLLPLVVWCGLRCRGLARLVLAGAAVGVLGWATGPPNARYLVPVLVPLAMLAGTGVASVLESSQGRARAALTSAIAVICMWSMLLGIDREMLVRAGAAMGRDHRSAALSKWASYWPAVEVVNDLPASSRVLLVGESRSLYFERDVLFEDPFQVPLVCELARHTGSATDMAAELRQQGVTHVLINRTEARRIASLNGRDDYFGELPADARARLEEFLSGHLQRVWSEGALELYALI